MLMLPTPLSFRECIPWIESFQPRGLHLRPSSALAVWLADPKSFEKFDQFMYAQPSPPTESSAHDFAAQLVGTDALAKSLTNPRIDHLINIASDAYRSNNTRLTTDVLPQIVAGPSLIQGTPTQTQLEKALAESLGIIRPDTTASP